MQPTATPVPAVLCIGGHDPTGGAGIQADIESVAAQGCHAITIPTCLTVQDTTDVRRVVPLDAEVLRQQASTLLDDIMPAAVKIGLLGSVGVLSAVEQVLDRLPGVPTVLDPVLRAGGGSDLADSALTAELRARFVPRADLLTPNRAEARLLAGTDDIDEAVATVLATGCRAVLLTGADESDGALIENRLIVTGETPRRFSWPRVEGRFHGSGCTLAASCAARLALGEELEVACRRAQAYAWQTIGAAHRAGGGQAIPGRIARPE